VYLVRKEALGTLVTSLLNRGFAVSRQRPVDIAAFRRLYDAQTRVSYRAASTATLQNRPRAPQAHWFSAAEVGDRNGYDQQHGGALFPRLPDDEYCYLPLTSSLAKHRLCCAAEGSRPGRGGRVPAEVQADRGTDSRPMEPGAHHSTRRIAVSAATS